MTISAILAVSRNNVIGRDNDLPWYLPNDLKFFKKHTLHRHIVMGRKNFESIGKPLPKRTNIVMTRDPFYVASNCLIVHSVEEAINIAKTNGEDELFIIGGSEIYTIFWPYISKLYLTKVEAEIPGDVTFDVNLSDEWKKISEVHHERDERNEYDHTFLIYERTLPQNNRGDHQFSVEEVKI